jgi:hypothetical protein
MSFAAIEQRLSRTKAAFGKYLLSNAPVMELFPQKPQIYLQWAF